MEEKKYEKKRFAKGKLGLKVRAKPKASNGTSRKSSGNYQEEKYEQTRWLGFHIEKVMTAATKWKTTTKKRRVNPKKRDWKYHQEKINMSGRPEAAGGAVIETSRKKRKDAAKWKTTRNKRKGSSPWRVTSVEVQRESLEES